MPDGSVTLPDGTETVWRCRECGTGFVPRDQRHIYCGQRCRDRVRARQPQRVVEARERREQWQHRNRAYHNMAVTLRRRGVTEQYAAQLEALKGRGTVSHDELASTFGAALARRPYSRKHHPSPQPTPGSWAQAHPHVLRALAWLHEHGMQTAERRAVLESVTDATSFDDALSRVGVDRGDPWRFDSPPHDGPLATAVQLRVLTPGGYPARGFDDPFRLRLLHGALHRRLEVGHRAHEAAFALRPRAGEVWLVTRDETVLSRLSSHTAVLGSSERVVRVEVGARAKLRPPPARPAGQYRVRVRVVTPLVLKRIELTDGRRIERLRDAPESLTQHLLRVGDRLRVSHRPLAAAVVAHDVERVLDSDGAEGVRVGGHLRFEHEQGRVAALVGVMDVECNGPARWLLDCAALVGLGGKTAFGFGAVRVEDV
jgi:hypothetical protein